MSCILEDPRILRELPATLKEWRINEELNQVVCGQCRQQLDCETVKTLLQPTKENGQFFAIATKPSLPEPVPEMRTQSAIDPDMHTDSAEIKGRFTGSGLFQGLGVEEKFWAPTGLFPNPDSNPIRRREICGLVLYDKERKEEVLRIRLLCSVDAAVRASILNTLYYKARESDRVKYLVVDEAVRVTPLQGALIISEDPDFPGKVTYYTGAQQSPQSVQRQKGRAPTKGPTKTIQKIQKGLTTGIKVGDKVEAWWSGRYAPPGSEEKIHVAQWWPAQIVAVDASGKYRVRYYVNDDEEPDVPRSRIRV